MAYPVQNMTMNMNLNANEDQNKESFPVTYVLPSITKPEVPLNPENRRRTDTWFLFVFIFSIIIVLIYLLVCIVRYSDDETLNRLHHNLFYIMAHYFIVLPSLGAAIILIILLRYATVFAVWFVLLSSWSLLPIYVATSRYYLERLVTIIIILVSVLLLLAMISNARKINRNTLLFKEAAMALFHVKAIFIIMITVLCVYSLMILAFMSIITSLYRPNIEIYLSVVMFVWIIAFVYGILTMTVSLAVSNCYCARNNGNFNKIVLDCLCVTVKNHLGTVAVVSLLSLITAIPLIILKCLAQFKVMKTFVDFCMDYMNGCFSKNVYILTAIYGSSFFQSAKKGLRLFRQSIGDTEAAFYFVEFIIVLSQILIFSIYVVYYHFERVYYYDIYGAVFTMLMCLLCVNVILSLVEVASNTIFICTTEQLLDNREAHLPYSMTEREFLNASTNLFFEKVQNKRLTNV